MKRYFIRVTIMLILFFGISSAQLVKNYGLKFAVTYSSQSFEYPTPPWGWWTGCKTSSKSGFNIAAFAEWFNLPFFSVVSQIEYVQRGTRLMYLVPGGMWSTEGRINYLSIPILAKVGITGGAISPYIIVGPRVDFLVNYKEIKVKPDLPQLYRDFKRIISGASFGVGMQLSSLLPISILTELRYNIDFFNSYDKENLKVRGNALDIWLGVAF